MIDEMQSSPLRLSRLMDVQVAAVERLLNDIGTHGLRVSHVEGEQWQWEWCGHSALAHGMGSAIVTACYWYVGLLSDVEAGIQQQAQHLQ